MQQQPRNVSEGLHYFINHAILRGFTCNFTTFSPNFTITLEAMKNDKIECVSATELIRVSFLPCYSSISVMVLNKSGSILFDRQLFSAPYPQQYSYGNNIILAITVQVVLKDRHDMNYYLLMMYTTHGLQFQSTAIPLNCIGNHYCFCWTYPLKEKNKYEHDVGECYTCAELSMLSFRS